MVSDSYDIINCERCGQPVAKLNRNQIEMLKNSGVTPVLYHPTCKGAMEK